MHHVQAMINLVRGDVKHLPVGITRTVMSFSIFYFAFGFIDPYLAIYLETFSTSYAEVGAYNTILSVTGALVLIPLGLALDRSSHSYLINIGKTGTAIYALLMFLAGMLYSKVLLVCALVLGGLMVPLVWVGTSATVREHSTPKNASMAFGFYMSMRNMAVIAGMVIALLLFVGLPLHYLFIPATIFPLLSMLVGRGVRSAHNQHLKDTLKDIVVTDKLVLRFFKEIKEYNWEMRWMYILYFFAATIPGMAALFLPLYAQQIGMTFSEIGVLVIFMNVPYILSFFAAEISDRSERLTNIIMGFFVASIAAVLLSFFHTEPWHLYAFGFLLVSGYAAMTPSMSSVISMLTQKDDVGVNSSLTFILINTSIALFSPIIGRLADIYNWPTTFQIMAALFAGFGIIVLLLKLRFSQLNLIYKVNHPRSNKQPYIL